LIDKCIRAIHEKSFIDDPTRIYRAARFASRYGFQVARDTESWIQKSLEEEFPALLSPARRRHEFDLILKEDQPEPCLTLLQNWNALRFIHIDWNQLSAKDFLVLNRKPDNSNKISLLTWRWVYWLKNFGSEKATKMMADLAFEKDQKKQIQALL
jgi:tRNA nucleotidyltransferase/poly(A) polymerase